jgi:hypothetical protein
MKRLQKQVLKKQTAWHQQVEALPRLTAAPGSFLPNPLRAPPQRRRAAWRPAERDTVKRLFLAYGVGRWREVGGAGGARSGWPGSQHPTSPHSPLQPTPTHPPPHPPHHPPPQIYAALHTSIRSLRHGVGDVEDACWEVLADAWGGLSEAGPGLKGGADALALAEQLLGTRELAGAPQQTPGVVDEQVGGLVGRVDRVG